MYNHRMDTMDWILTTVMAVLMGGAGYLVLPPYGAIGGVALAVFLVWRAKKNRDRLRKRS